jgi:hypothetical protein
MLFLETYGSFVLLFDTDCGMGFNWRAPSGLKVVTAP